MHVPATVVHVLVALLAIGLVGAIPITARAPTVASASASDPRR